MFRSLAGKLALAAAAAITVPLLASSASATTSPAPVVIPDSALQATSTTVGGAKLQPSTTTLTHFFRTAVNPLDSTTYGFNMVGQDPALQQSTTITVDVTPLNVITGGLAFNGTDVLQPTLSSPVFTNQDYTSTQFASDPTVANGHTTGGSLSPGNTSNQLEDAIMRSQFNEQGTGYHLILNPVVHPAITIDVPSELGTTIQTPRGVVAGDVQVKWWSTRIQNSFVQPWTSPAIAPMCSNILETGDPVVGDGFTTEANAFRQGPTPNGTQVADGFYHPEDEALLPSLSYTDLTHLQLYLTDNVMLFSGTNSLNCCIIGFHR